MDQLTERQIRQHVLIIGWLHITLNIFTLLMAVVIFAFLASQQSSRNAEEAEANFQLAATREVEAVSEAQLKEVTEWCRKRHEECQAWIEGDRDVAAGRATEPQR